MVMNNSRFNHQFHHDPQSQHQQSMTCGADHAGQHAATWHHQKAKARSADNVKAANAVLHFAQQAAALALQRPGKDEDEEGRVPAWNLAGLLPPDPTSTGPGGVVSSHPGGTSLAHPLPHYTTGAYGGQHYLLPQQGNPEAWPPNNMEAAAAASVAANSPSSAAPPGGLNYKMDPDAMSAMYYPPTHQIPTTTETGSSSTSSSAATTTTTAVSIADGLHVPNFALTASTSAANLDPQDMITLHQYLGTTPDMPGLSEEGASWFDPSQAAAAAAAAAANHHHLDPYHLDFSRVGHQDRKKKIIKEWNSKASSNGNEVAAAAAAAAAAARGFVDFPGYEGGNIHHYPYGYPDGLVHPWHHHYPAQHHQHQMAPQAGPSGQMGHMSSATTAPGVPGPSGSSLGGKRERKRKSASAESALSGLPAGVNVSQMTRDERRALGLSLPISVQEIINLPMDEFNDLLSKHEMSEEQLTLCRDIRRRGKNKVAARNCRKRKIDQIKQLEEDVQRIKCRKTELLQEHDRLLLERSRWADKVKRLHDYVLKELGHNPNHWQLQMDHNRQVHILPRSHADDQDPLKAERVYHYVPSLGPPLMEGTIPSSHLHHPSSSHRS